MKTLKSASGRLTQSLRRVLSGLRVRSASGRLSVEAVDGVSRRILQFINEGVVVTDHRGRVVWLNTPATTILATNADHFLGRKFDDFLGSCDRDNDGLYWMESEKGLRQSLSVAEHQLSPGDISAMTPSQDQAIDEVCGNRFYVLTNRTEWSKLRDDAHYNATHDPLTGFTSRSMLNEHVDKAIARASRSGSGFAVLMIDIDRFHLINDSYGHSEGDRILVLLADRIQSVCRADDLTVRFANDVFLVLMERLIDRGDAGILAEKILAAVNEPIDIRGDSVSVTASCGISVWPDDSEKGPPLIRNAELALRKVKQRRGDYQFFSSELEIVAKQERVIRQELRSAVLAGDFALHFQPQISLSDGKIKGFEALIRWPRSGRDTIAPSIFIPIAESAGLIEAITDWVAREALAQSRQWQRNGLGKLDMSINVSARHFVHANIADDLARVLAEEAASDLQLTVEVTESMLMSEPKRAVSILERLKSMGIKVAIDDFGKGYSSLAYLQEFPIDSLKIDRAFISQIGFDKKQNEIVTAIAHLAQNLGLRVVAEGVETPDQASFLASLGCQDAQGFLYSKPVPASAVPMLFAHQADWSMPDRRLH